MSISHYKNYTIHFTIKDQSLEKIKEKLKKYLDKLPFQEKALAFHHCFMPRTLVEEKGFSTDLVDVLDELCIPDQIRWYNTTDSIAESRRLMLNNIAQIPRAQALFIGEIKEGVKEEYDLAKQLGIDCVLIP